MKKQLCGKENAGVPLFPAKDLPEISGPGLYEKRSLVEKNLAIVTFVANKYTGRATEFEDLVSVGNIGLIKAADTFDPFKNVQFSPYASRCIENKILMYLRKNTRREVPLGNWKAERMAESGEDLVWAEMKRSIDLARVKETAKRLPPKQKKIICLRFGFGGERQRTQKEVARIAGVSQSCVSKVERKFSFLLKAAMGDDVK